MRGQRKSIRNNSICINTGTLQTIEQFNGFLFNHGVDFESAMSIENSIKAIEENKHIHICCSYDNEYVGNIGVSVSGEVKCAFNRDVWSSMNNDGTRTIMFRNLEELNKSILSIDQLEESLEDGDIHLGYGEAIVTNAVINHVWVKSHHIEKYAEILDVLESKYRIIFI